MFDSPVPKMSRVTDNGNDKCGNGCARRVTLSPPHPVSEQDTTQALSEDQEQLESQRQSLGVQDKDSFHSPTISSSHNKIHEDGDNQDNDDDGGGGKKSTGDSTATDNKDMDDEEWIYDEFASNLDDDDDDDYYDQEALDDDSICLDDYAGDYDAEAESFSYNDTTIDWTKYIMPLSACATAKSIILPYCKEAIDIVQRFFENPMGAYATALELRKILSNAGIYVIFDKTGLRIIKVGYTKNFLKRLSFYTKNGMDPSRFRVILDFDNTDQLVHDKMEDVYTRAKAELTGHPHLHPFQRFFFKQMFERGGDRMGGKRTFWLQLLESGYQDKWDLPAPMEFLMFKESILDRWYKDASDMARELLGLLAPVLNAAALEQNQQPVTTQMISSWPAAVRGFASTVVTNE